MKKIGYIYQQILLRPEEKALIEKTVEKEIELLQHAGVFKENIFIEKVDVREKPFKEEFSDLDLYLDTLEKGDVLVIPSLKHLGDSLTKIRKRVLVLNSSEMILQVLDFPSTPKDDLFVQEVLLYFLELDSQLSRKKMQKVPRRTIITPSMLDKADSLLKMHVKKKAIYEQLKISKSTFSKLLAKLEKQVDLKLDIGMTTGSLYG